MDPWILNPLKPKSFYPKPFNLKPLNPKPLNSNPKPSKSPIKPSQDLERALVSAVVFKGALLWQRRDSAESFGPGMVSFALLTV